VPEGGDVVRRPGAFRIRRLARFATTRQGGRLAGDAPLGQQLTGRVPPPGSVLHARPVHETTLDRDLLDRVLSAVGCRGLAGAELLEGCAEGAADKFVERLLVRLGLA
jgi:hypothetical protein